MFSLGREGAKEGSENEEKRESDPVGGPGEAAAG